MISRFNPARLTASVVLMFAAAAPAAQAQTGPHNFSGGDKFQERGGEAIYQGICQGCHMPQGQGAVGAGAYPALAGNPIAAVANYVRSHFSNSYADRVTAAEVKALRPKHQAPSE
jgi:mono/diheme cytochrome c family protein